MSDNFIERRKNSWKQLEDMLDQAQSLNGMKRFTRHEVRELGRSYRRTATDLAIARVESRDQRLVSYLNNLVIKSHGMIYRTKSEGPRAVLNFYLHLFPAIFRKTYRYTLAVFLLFVSISLCSFIATWRNDDFADFANAGGIIYEIKAGNKWWEKLNKEAPVGAAGIIANNIGVGIFVFAMSIFPVVGTLKTLMPTALQFGAIIALVIKYGWTLTLFEFVAGHAVLEFTAIFIAGGAGLMIGMALLVPGERTRGEALIENGTTAIKLMAGCFPLFLIAGCIEGFISPLPIHYGYRFAVSAATAITLTAYLLKPAPAEEEISAVK